MRITSLGGAVRHLAAELDLLLGEVVVDDVRVLLGHVLDIDGHFITGGFQTAGLKTWMGQRCLRRAVGPESGRIRPALPLVAVDDQRLADLAEVRFALHALGLLLGALEPKGAAAR
jgi:hypothetical protein